MTRSRLEALLAAFKGLKIKIIGDFLLDRYLIGETERISREAPVIVIQYTHTVHHPGGAANAAQNVVSLGGDAELHGVVGEDADGLILRGLLSDRGMATDGLIASGELETAVKTRVMAGELHAQRQQIVRLDRSYRIDQNMGVVKRLTEAVAGSVGRSNAVLISDYGMGLIPGPASRTAIEAGRRQRIPVVVDSRYNLLDYQGAATATPNETEAVEALGYKSGHKPPIDRLSEILCREAGLDGVIITRGRIGMFVRQADGTTREIGVVGSSEATDVTGAGDTVSAVTALSLAAGAGLSEAAEMATYAASVVVMKRGTVAVTPEELRRQFELYSPSG